MTLVVAIGCSNGVVLAADSASSDPVSGTKQIVNKICRLGELPILYAGSGDVGLLQKINDGLSAFTSQSSMKRIRQQIRRIVIPELKEAQDLHVPYPQQGFDRPPEAVLLFVGIHDKKPWILEIEKDGRDTVYGEELGLFTAIGSGKPWAQAAFSPHLNTERNVELGKVFAYRVVEDSINLAVGFLAKPISLYTITCDGNVLELSDEERMELETTCGTWRGLEQEAVGTLLSKGKGPEKKAEVPTPE